MDTQPDKLLKDISITIGDTEHTIGSLMYTLFNYMTCIPATTKVTVYKALVDQTGSLVNQGDNVAFGISGKVNRIRRKCTVDIKIHTGGLR